MWGMSQSAISDYYGRPENVFEWCRGERYLGDPFTKIVPHIQDMLPDMGMASESEVQEPARLVRAT